MNCNCNSNIINNCGESNADIKIYGHLVNNTLDNTLDDANCNANDKSYDTGHNDAIAYAYQLHDGRFKAGDTTLPEHERFQDAINRRVTNIKYNPSTNTTTIEGNVVISGGNISSYDDGWLKNIIGTTPATEQQSAGLLQSDFPQESGDIISYIRLLKQKIDTLQQQITNITGGACYWKVDNNYYLTPDETAIGHACAGVKGPGFYDTTVNNPV